MPWSTGSSNRLARTEGNNAAVARRPESVVRIAPLRAGRLRGSCVERRTGRPRLVVRQPLLVVPGGQEILAGVQAVVEQRRLVGIGEVEVRGGESGRVDEDRAPGIEGIVDMQLVVRVGHCL